MKLQKTAVLLTLFLFVLIVSCAEKGMPTSEDIEKKGKEFSEIAKEKRFTMHDDPYMGVRAVPIRENQKTSQALRIPVVLKVHGTIEEIVMAIGTITPLNVQVGSDPETIPGMGQSEPTTGGAKRGQQVHVNYEGPLEGLLEQVSVATGYGWDYDDSTKTVTFSRFIVKTFTVMGAPGKREFTDQITNKSKEAQTSNIGGSNVNATVGTGDTASQTIQTNKTTYNFDIWADTEKAIKAMLSKEGSVVTNPVAGTITVRDHASNVRAVGRYIADLNVRLSRQVALTVHVWAVEINNDVTAGLDLSVLFTSPDVSVVAGALQTTLGAAGTASATILKGKLKNSEGVLKALKEWGNATQVTSGGGITLSNQPVPIQAISRVAYLAGSSTSNTDYNQTTTLTPGEVTTGFAMTIVPHILDRRRVILQYTINMSKLDDMREFTNNEVTIQLPQTSNRAFSQRSTLQMGETLILAGFQDQTQKLSNTLGLVNAARDKEYSKTILVITIETEAAGGGTED